MKKHGYLSATTIAQRSYCENQLVLDQKYDGEESDRIRLRRERGNEEHLRHHLTVQKYGSRTDSRCFIATELYGQLAEETNLLRNYRDTVLMKRKLGRAFIDFYYAVSPSVVVLIKKYPFLRSIFTKSVNFVVSKVRKRVE